MDLPIEVRLMIYKLCFGCNARERLQLTHKIPPLCEKAFMTLQERRVDTYWNVSLLRATKIIYEEAIDLAYARNAFTVPWNTAAYRRLRPTALASLTDVHIGDTEYKNFVPNLHLLEDLFNTLSGHTRRLDNLKIIIDPDALMQAVPYLTEWIAAEARKKTSALKLEVEAFGNIHAPCYNQASRLLNGDYGPPSRRTGNFAKTAPFYFRRAWPSVAETMSKMPEARNITFRSVALGVGEIQALDEYKGRGFQLKKAKIPSFASDLGLGNVMSSVGIACSYTWEAVEGK